MIELLAKYHNQKRDKNVLKEYKDVNSRYALKKNIDDPFDQLYLSLFMQSMLNKNAIENQFDRIRNENYDLWSVLDFKERNFILQLDMKQLKNEMTHFEDNGVRIFIPFFDELLNALYDNETAILELPQYLKMYDSFSNRIIDMNHYGLLPYRASMTCARCLVSKPQCIVLYDDKIHTFYYMDQSGHRAYFPLADCSVTDDTLLQQLALILCDQNYDAFLDKCIENNLLKSRCAKKIERLKRKEAKRNGANNGIK